MRKERIIDYSEEVKLSSSRLLRLTYLGLAWFFVGLGIVGIVLPLLPATPFFLLASFLFAKCSNRFYNWLMNHNLVGHSLRNWRDYGVISRKAKFWAIILLWLSLGYSIFFVVPLTSIRILLFLTGLGVSWFLLSRPHCQSMSGKNLEGRVTK